MTEQKVPDECLRELVIDTIDDLRTKLGTAEAKIQGLERELEKHASIEEKAHLQTIDERDRAEEAISQAYYLCTGQSPEWSNLFGHDEAIEAIDVFQKIMRSENKRLEDTLATITAERDALFVSLQGLWARHKDGSDEQFWAEWDLVQDALKQKLAELSVPATTEATNAWLVSPGAEMIVAERERQVTNEGWTPEHDDSHRFLELSRAAECYIHSSQHGHIALPRAWPWDKEWWKPADDPVRNLVKAGALIAAEIDRLQRQSSQKPGGGLSEVEQKQE